MEQLISWHDLYNVGIPEIDQQHQTLFSIFNSLITCIHSKNSTHKDIEDAIGDFFGYMNYHNNFEESLMKTFKYPNRKPHMVEHHVLMAKLRDLLKPHDASYDLVSESTHVLLEALAEHVSGDDLELGAFLKSKIAPGCDVRQLV